MRGAASTIAIAAAASRAATRLFPILFSGSRATSAAMRFRHLRSARSPGVAEFQIHALVVLDSARIFEVYDDPLGRLEHEMQAGAGHGIRAARERDRRDAVERGRAGEDRGAPARAEIGR